MSEPANKRAVVFVDGQNLFHAAREAFGYTHPNYDVLALANALCALQAWNVEQVRFYTGIPHATAAPFWNHFWTHKLAAMGRQGVVVFSRHLRYRNRSVTLGDGTHHTFLTGEEKGIDVRIALDVISLAHARAYDVALVLSQNQDLSEVAEEIRTIAREQQRWIKLRPLPRQARLPAFSLSWTYSPSLKMRSASQPERRCPTGAGTARTPPAFAGCRRILRLRFGSV